MKRLKSLLLNKANLWHVGAVALFIIISCVYFSPALKGYAVEQGDVVNYVGASREIVDYRDNNGEEVLWTNAMFSGMPSTQISIIYDNTFLARGLAKIIRLGLPAPIFFLFVYFLGFYILALSLRIKPLIGIIGSLAFGFSSYFIVIIEAGHNTKAAALGFVPFMIAGFIMAYRFKNWFLGVALSALFMTLELGTNHIQITYYMSFVLLLMGVVELVRYIKENQLLKFVKITGLLLVGYAFAIMVNYGNLFGTIDYAKHTIRGGTELTITPNGETNEKIKTSGLDRDYVTNWSYGRAETFSLVVPNFKGGETQAISQNDANKSILKEVDGVFRQNVGGSNQYWGDQPFTSGPVYIGIIVMFLAFLGLVYVKDKYKWALLSVTLLAITLSWGKNYVSAFILLPILLYNVNIFIEDKKKQLAVSAGITLIFLFAIAKGELFVASSLTDFFLDYVPGYNKLRAVTIILVVVELCVPLLGILFLQRLFKAREKILKNSLGFYVVTGVFTLFLIVLLISPSSFNDFINLQEAAQLELITDPVAQGRYFEFYDALEQARISIFKADVLRSFGFFVLGAGVIFAFIRIGFSKLILGGVLALFILLDLMLVDQRYLNNDGRGNKYDQWVENYQMKYPFTAGEGEKAILQFEIAENPAIAEKIDSALLVLNTTFKTEDDVSAREKQVRRDFITYRILNRNSNFRVYEEGNPYNSSYTSYFNKSIGGYHGAKLGRYQELIDFHISVGNPSVINMLNTKYFLRPERGGSKIINTKLTQVNRSAMGNAWFSKAVQLVENADEEIMALEAFNGNRIVNKGLGQVFVDGSPIQNAEVSPKQVITVLLVGMQEPMIVENIPYGALTAQALALVADSTGLNWIYDAAPDSLFDKVFSMTNAGVGGWDPAKTTVMDKRFAENATSASYSGNGSIEMTSYHPDRMSYTSSSTDKQLAVFSEIYYADGWKAYVDDQEVPVSRVNYVLRAIEVPAGKHDIRFEFKLESYEKAKTMALIGTIAILLMLAFGIYLEAKREDEVELETEAIEPSEQQ